ncbi:hypothetical protein J5N97_016473 [Dioscorea zingiberensis]|uniref:Uncharacterized protein n=1 Tax=Dioscorea zingiberensis TaxID=325984 RepID=A0A9D5HFN9_9LILI|nr:hypothetical protein J5N97_016473 [Dioscorea zingiberensis]
MGLFSLFVVASRPILQVLLMALVGAFLSSGYSNIFKSDARRDMNKVVFSVFTPALIYSSLAETVTIQEIISWWFMPVNIGIVFVIGTILGWLIVKILRPEQYLEGVVMATCSAGNLGNLLLIIIPAICDEDGSPFGETSICKTRALSYSSLSMALGSFFIWSHTYSLMRKSGILYEKLRHDDELPISSDQNPDTIKVEDGEASKGTDQDAENQIIVPLLSGEELGKKKSKFWEKLNDTLHMIYEELLAPPNIAAIIGFVIGVIPWLKSLLIGDTAPLRVIQDSLTSLGAGTIPCITLILGGNLMEGLRKSTLKPMLILSILFIKYIILPLVGIAIVKAAAQLGFLPKDPLYHYLLMIQFSLPPAMNIGTMAQLFNVGQDECSVIFLWTYLAATPALSFWSTIYLGILS